MSRRLLQSIAPLLLLLPLLSLHAGQSPSPKDSKLAKTRSMAATQHEIVVLLLSKKEYAKALHEASKIFSMKWPDDHEPILIKELLFFTDQFLHHKQPAMGIQLLDSSSKSFRATPSLVAIWKEKGYLHKEMNQPDKALECFREAQRLEEAIK
jgi:tetratricopeptide (TPR) repeat protein